MTRQREELSTDMTIHELAALRHTLQLQIGSIEGLVETVK